MSTSYELLFLHSIPFLARVGDVDKRRKLYYYDAKHISDGTEPIAIGVRNEDGSIALDEGWQLRLQSRVDAWKGVLTASERGVLQPRAPKPSKPKRISPKAAGMAGAACGGGGHPLTKQFDLGGSASSNVIIIPGEANAKSAKGRRRVVRTNAKAV